MLSVLGDVTDSSANTLEAVLDGVASVPTDNEGKAAVDATVAGVDVWVPTSASDPIGLDSGRLEPVGITVPFSERADDAETVADGIVFDNKNGTSTVPVGKEDGSIQITAIIEDVSAPTRFPFVIDAPDGSVLVPTEQGSVAVLAADGSFLAGVAPAWARDADGAPVATHYEVDGSTLIQVVEHTSSGVAYPVTADPWLGINLFDSMATSSDQGQPRYVLTRSAWGGANSTSPGTSSSIFLNSGWAEASSRWTVLRSKESLHQQYDCHAWYALLKPGSWNLEKFRANKSDWGGSALSYQCNW